MRATWGTGAAMLALLSAVASSCTDSEPVDCANATWDNAHLLPDCLGVAEFTLREASMNATGAVFSWDASSRAELVVCGLFVDLPRFRDGELQNFDEVVTHYTTQDFTEDQPRSGTFDVAAARSTRRDRMLCPWKVL